MTYDFGLIALVIVCVCILAIAILLRPKASVTDGQFLSMQSRITALEGEIKGLHRENSELRAYLLMLISDPTNTTLHAIVRQKMTGGSGGSVVEMVASGNIAGAIDLAWAQATPDKIDSFTLLKSRYVRIVNDQGLASDERTRALNNIASDLLAMI
jgi:hypothetical protein